MHPLPMRVALLLALSLASAACAPARLGGGAPADAPAFRPVGDTAVVRGRLLNGLTYYIRRNAEPPGRAELRLVVNVGSVLEDDDQRGLAHFLEHMAFNGTRRFGGSDIVDYLERVGMRFGPDVNAYTSFDETVYSLHLPADSAGVLETGMEILADWAGGITLHPEDVEAERGVVLEEWRRRLGAGSRVADRELPFLFTGSRYAERMPIGDPEVIATFPLRALQRFHARWYRTDLMAVVAVGDFDPAQVERLLREEFEPIRRTPGRAARRRPPPPVPDTTRYLVTVDPELTRTQISVHWMLPAPRDTSLARSRRSIVRAMYVGMLGDRLNELSLRPDAPFLDVGSYQGPSVRGVETLVLSAAAPEAGAERAYAALVAEVERAARHGFGGAELERERARVLRAWEQIHAEREKATSAQHAGRYVEHFLLRGPLRTTEDAYALHRHVVPAVTLEEVDAAAREYAAHAARSVLVTAPAGEGAPPDPARLASAADSARSAPLAALPPEAASAALIGALPPAGRVVAADSTPEAGVVRWTLSNGARVVLRPTDFREDEVLFAAVSPGGLSLLDDSLFFQGRTATAAVQLGGVGEHSLSELQRRLAGTAANVGSYISELTEGMNGSAAPADLETLFQLVHLYFTAPRRDPDAWEAYRQRGREGLRHRGATPEAAFADTLTAVLTRGHPRARPFTAAAFDSLDLDGSLAIYRDRFADASDFTFYFVGRFSPDSLRPLVERYLATLPAAGAPPERPRDAGIRPPEGVVRRTVRRGLEPKARTVLVFTGPAEFSRPAVSDIGALASALEIRLRERLREELGGTYTVSVGGSMARDPYPRYSFFVDFGAAPERVDALVEVVWEEIAAAREGALDEDVAARVREADRRTRELTLRDNSAWIAALVEYDRLGWDVRGFQAPPVSATLTPARLRDAALRYLDPGRYVQVTLLPERSEVVSR